MKAQRLSMNFLIFLIVLLWPPRPQSQESVRCDPEWEREHRCRGCGPEVTPDSCFAFHLPQPLGCVSPRGTSVGHGVLPAPRGSGVGLCPESLSLQQWLLHTGSAPWAAASVVNKSPRVFPLLTPEGTSGIRPNRSWEGEGSFLTAPALPSFVCSSALHPSHVTPGEDHAECVSEPPG